MTTAERKHNYYVAHKDKYRGYDLKRRAHPDYLSRKRDERNKNLARYRLKGRHHAALRRKTGQARLVNLAWCQANRDRVRQYNRKNHKKASVNLTDSYLRMLLKRYGVANPTQEQIEQRRAIISAKRASRQFTLIHKTNLLCKQLAKSSS
jgi:hypothetical protein